MNISPPSKPPGTTYLMGHYIYHPYCGIEYQFAVFTYLALRYLSRDTHPSQGVQFEVLDKSPFDDIAIPFATSKKGGPKVKVYQLKYYKGELKTSDFMGNDSTNHKRELHLGNLYLAWLKWHNSNNDHHIVPIIFTNADLQKKLANLLTEKKEQTYQFNKKAKEKISKYIQDYLKVLNTKGHDSNQINNFLSTLKIKCRQWSLNELEGCSLGGTVEGEISKLVAKQYNDCTNPKLLAVYIQWRIRDWFKKYSPTGTNTNQPIITKILLDQYAQDFKKENTDILHLLLHAKERVFDTIETSIAGEQFDVSDLIETVKEKLRNKNKLVIEGEKGVGKSALAKLYLENSKACVLAFSADEIRGCATFASFCKRRLLINAPFDPYKNHKEPKILYVDAAEKIAAADFNCLEEMINFYSGYDVLITCTSEARASHFSDQNYSIISLNNPSIPPNLINSPLLQNFQNNSSFELFFQRPFLFKMLYKAIQCELKDSKANSKEQALRKVRCYLWNHWICKGTDGPQRKAKELFLFDLLVKQDQYGGELALQKYLLSHHAFQSELQEAGILDTKGRFQHDILREWAIFSLFDAAFEKQNDPLYFSYLSSEFVGDFRVENLFNYWFSECYKNTLKGGHEQFKAFIKCASTYSKSVDYTALIGRILNWGLKNQQLDSLQLVNNSISYYCTTYLQQELEACEFYIYDIPIYNPYKKEILVNLGNIYGFVFYPSFCKAIIESGTKELLSLTFCLLMKVEELQIDLGENQKVFNWLIAIASKSPLILKSEEVKGYFKPTGGLLLTSITHFLYEDYKTKVEFDFGDIYDDFFSDDDDDDDDNADDAAAPKSTNITILSNSDSETYVPEAIATDYNDTKKLCVELHDKKMSASRVLLFLKKGFCPNSPEEMEGLCKFYRSKSKRVDNVIKSIKPDDISKDWLDFAISAASQTLIKILLEKKKDLVVTDKHFREILGDAGKKLIKEVKKASFNRSWSVIEETLEIIGLMQKYYKDNLSNDVAAEITRFKQFKESDCKTPFTF